MDVADDVLAALEVSLSDEERERAQRFRAVSDARRFVAARGWLRQLLGGYLDADPAALTLVGDANGKLLLASHEAGWLRFNVSHSGEVAVFAAARDREIGIDVELVTNDVAIDDIAARVFSAAEIEALAAVPEDERVAAFFACWTRNEALLKGIGVGFGSPRQVVADGWSVSGLDVGTEYAGAVAVRGSGAPVPEVAEPLSLAR